MISRWRCLTRPAVRHELRGEPVEQLRVRRRRRRAGRSRRACRRAPRRSGASRRGSRTRGPSAGCPSTRSRGPGRAGRCRGRTACGSGSRSSRNCRGTGSPGRSGWPRRKTRGSYGRSAIEEHHRPRRALREPRSPRPRSFWYSPCVARSGKSERKPQSSASGASAGDVGAVEHAAQRLRVRVGVRLRGGSHAVHLGEQLAVSVGDVLHRLRRGGEHLTTSRFPPASAATRSGLRPNSASGNSAKACHAARPGRGRLFGSARYCRQRVIIVGFRSPRSASSMKSSAGGWLRAAWAASR